MATKKILKVSGAATANPRLRIFEETNGLVAEKWDSYRAALYANGDVTPVDGAVALETNGVVRLAFAANATDEVTLVLPTPAIDGTTLDFVLDVENPQLDPTAESWPDAYDSTATYAVGDKASRDGKIYRCTTEISTAEAWTSAHWEEAVPAITLGDALDNTLSVVVPEGESLADWFAIAPGEMSEFYFTLTAFKVNGLPTWKIAKGVVENGGAV